MNATITLRDYLGKGKCFVVPDYQRGYVWGKNKPNAKNAVTYMMESLTNGFKAKTEVFIQGVTVSEAYNEILLIDGQQRTTFFYLLLKTLGYKENFRIKYNIREESDKFLGKLTEEMLNDLKENDTEEFQDIYFFKKTLRLIRESPIDMDREIFLNYVLDYVKFLYIDIPQDKATTVFSMMNGNKAEMKPEELIKAELLRLASLNEENGKNCGEKELYSVEWDNNMLRSRYAREWDKWLQWWNREDVKSFYKVTNVMGLLVATMMDEPLETQSFEAFRNKYLVDQKPIVAKKTFDKLRRLQKRFEDAFNNPKVYNWVGTILRICGNEHKAAFIRWYFKEEPKKTSEKELEEYYQFAFLQLTHKEILGRSKETIDKKFEERYKELESNELYGDNPEAAFRLLLRLNIDEDNKQHNGDGRKFDFSIWDRNDSRGRSLEHIYPKSKVLHKEIDASGNEVIKNGKDEIVSPTGDSYIWREDCKCDSGNGECQASEHSIGNLVLLYKDDNSAFNDSTFEDKKAMFFKRPEDGKEAKAIFKSRHLLHTIYRFANSEWNGEEIAKNKLSILKEFKEYYGKE